MAIDYTIELVGGKFDGERFAINQEPLPDTIRMPDTVGITLKVRKYSDHLPEIPILIYHYRGCRDDGTRWYRLR